LREQRVFSRQESEQDASSPGQDEDSQPQFKRQSSKREDDKFSALDEKIKNRCNRERLQYNNSAEQ